MWRNRTREISFAAIQGDPDMVTKLTDGYVNEQNAWVERTSEEVPTRLAKLKGKKVIGWKKCSWYDKRLKVRRHAMVKLEIAANTQRIQPKNYKCRAASAKVLMIFECAPGNGSRYHHWKLTGRSLRVARSYHDDTLAYRVGARVKPLPMWTYQYLQNGQTIKRRHKGTEKFVRNHNECAPGIHFFLTQKEAQRYSL